MKYSAFIKNVRSHLGNYKNTVLGVRENGQYNGREYGHIIPKEYEKLNLGLPESEYILEGSLIKLKGCPVIKLHKDWRHMNSSQVLCLAYFYDFISNEEKLQQLISGALKINAKAIKGEFEYIVKNDGSNIDFVVYLENSGMVYFEIKYTEPEFGTASSDTADYQRIKNDCHSAVEISDEDYRCQYQFVRNVCLSPKGSDNHTVFLLPRVNESINIKYDDGIKAIKNFDKFNVQRLYWEDLLDQIPNETVYQKYFQL